MIFRHDEMIDPGGFFRRGFVIAVFDVFLTLHLKSEFCTRIEDGGSFTEDPEATINSTAEVGLQFR